MEECKHIYGYDDWTEFEENYGLCFREDDFVAELLDERFNFCPRCGKRLVNEQ